MTTTDPTEAGRALAARRPRATYVCEVCSKTFEATVQTGARTPTTCSGQCRDKRYHRRKRQRKQQQATTAPAT